MKSRFSKAVVAGISVEVWKGGAGKPLLFLHPGDGIDSSVPALERLAERYSVTALSHPGFGDSELPDGFTTVDDLAYFYLDLLEALDLRDVTLVGVSLGAWLAAEIATKNSTRLAALVLTSAIGAKFSGSAVRDIADLFALPLYEQSRLYYADGRKIDYSAWPEEALLRLARAHRVFSRLSWAPTLHNPKLAQRLHRIDVPTLVLWGECDHVVSLDYGRRFADAIPGAAFEVVPGAGHYLHVEDAAHFADAVDDFAAACLPAAARP